MPHAERAWGSWAIAAGAVVVALCLAFLLPQYLLLIGTSALIAMVSLMALGIVTGTAGMIALCQLTFAAVGAWVLDYLMTHTSLAAALGAVAFPVAMIVGAVAASALGFVVGLPALRLRGVNLAVVTLGVAAAADLTIEKVSFPDQVSGTPVARPFGIPGIADLAGNRNYFLFTLAVAVLIAVAVSLLQRSRIGSGWRSVAFSERGTASAGSSVTSAKLSAFTVSAFIGGLAGGLTMGQLGTANYTTFSTANSLGLYVLSIVVGAHLIDMAILGALIFVLLPELLKQFDIPLDWADLAYGVLGVVSLTTNSNLGTNVRNGLLRRRRRQPELVVAGGAPDAAEPSAPPTGSAEVLLEVRGLAVEFGAVKALSGVELRIHRGEILGLIGPNGAGKSTLVDALTGFLPAHSGTVRLAGRPIDRLTPHRVARLGLRRTFQQDRVPSTMTIGTYAKFVARGRTTTAQLDEVLEYLGCPPRSTPLQIVDAGTRRLIEVAANLAAAPQVLLLDEPAAGLSHDQHLAFANRLRGIPERFGTTLLIIEHDLDLVRSVCSRIAVLDFGEVLAVGDRETVLSDPRVLKAYMGEMEML
ncbi:ATP-binding cassette domain-containing protein [Lysinimonas soli]|uniref:ATP-binding cassette domain-containing protein n=1 Tax=Lysinimonas soli TaxID=1074233 RepID=A0ABW0NRG8_9MICO